MDNAVGRSKSEGIPVLGLRFKDDRLCPAQRFETLRAGFGERFRPIEVAGRGHSVLTMDFGSMDEADRLRVWTGLIGFLNERLKA
jgi:hypothetical protein